MADNEEVKEVTPPVDPKAASNDPSERRMSVRESVAAARAEVKANLAKQAEEIKEPVKEVPKEPVKAVTEPEEKPKELDAEPKAKVKSEVDEPESQTLVETQKPTGLAAPSSWNKNARARWDEIPADLQQEIHRREEAGAKGIADLKQGYAELDSALAPYMNMIRQAGRTPAQTIQAMFQWHAGLSGPNKVDAFRQLAQSFNVDLAQVVPTGAQNSAPAANPELATALKPFEERLSGIQSHLDAQRQQAERAEFERGQRQLEEWAKDKPYYERVRGKMHSLMALDAAALAQGLTPQNGFIKTDGNVDLDACYQVACNTDATIRAEMQDTMRREIEAKAKEAAAAEAKKLKDQAEAKRKEVERAKEASVSLPVNGAPAAGQQLNGTKKPGKETARESIRRAFAEHKAGRGGV